MLKAMLVPVLLFIWMTPAYSVAYCALRDPVRKIYRLFPEATSYRSIVHEIDESTQQQVKSSIPFSIHKDELGQHTLYIAMDEQTPLGIVHSRSEVGLWGLIEIVWAFDFDMNVVDFEFQRCRERACKLVENLGFRQILQEKSTAELSAMLDQDQMAYPANIANDEEAKVLAKTIIRSAIKTARVTELSWHDELLRFKAK
jgi:hypothetical protein